MQTGQINNCSSMKGAIPASTRSRAKSVRIQDDGHVQLGPRAMEERDHERGRSLIQLSKTATPYGGFLWVT